MKPFLVVFSFLMICTLALGACPAPQPTPDPSPTPAWSTSVKPCAASTPMPSQADVCDGRYTAADALPCVKCAVAAACVLNDETGHVIAYCSASCRDTACTPEAAKPKPRRR